MDYREDIQDDIREWCDDNLDKLKEKHFKDEDELEEYLQDQLWNEDSVTGNYSGSYTYNECQAQENLVGNWDLLDEALTEFGNRENPIKQGAEWCDCIVRCYLLSECIFAVLPDIWENLQESEIAEPFDLSEII